MKVHRIVMCVVDHDDLGALTVRAEIEDVRYPNRCISPRVVAVETREIDWHDDHPLNRTATVRTEFARLFADAHVEIERLITAQKLVESHALAVAAYAKNVETPTAEVVKAFADTSAALVAALTGGDK